MDTRSLARTAGRIVTLTAISLALGQRAHAQMVFESIGERALGMGGAFVAVADDATATHWNPAGLASGKTVGMTIGTSRFHFGNQKGVPQPGPAQGRATLTSFGSLPLGISYGTFQLTTLTSSEAGVRAETTKASQYAVTVLQSVLPGVVVGSTLKLLRGHVSSELAQGQSAEDALKSAAGLKGDRHTAFDLDIGVMASSDLVRIGLTFKNLRSPGLGVQNGANRPLPRQARLGFALIPVAGLTLAMDVDLNTVGLMGDLRRKGAFGGEIALGPRLSARSGIRWSFVGPRRPVGAFGLSLSVRRGLWVDWHYAKGRLDEDREFGAALRAGF